MSNVETIKEEIEAINKEFGLVEENGMVTTTSLKVAEVYGKEHRNVTAKIRDFIEIVPELGVLNFKQSSYINEQGKEQPMFTMDRQGFSMLVNKFTGIEATKFTYKYTLAFERMIELISQLEEENEQLYEIAVSDESQLERQHEADKIKFSIRNIEKVLSNAKYTELEDTIDKIIDVHTHLKLSDRSIPNQRKSKTEYKKYIMTFIDDKLDRILLRNSDMLYHGVATELQKRLKDDKLATTNRSAGQIISNRERKINELQGGEEE